VTGIYEGKEWSQDFDFLYVACPPTEKLPMDWNEEESKIFSKLNFDVMTSTLVEVDPDPNLKEHVQLMVDTIFDVDRFYSGEPIAIRDAYRSLRNDYDDINEKRWFFVAQLMSRENYSKQEVNRVLEEFFAKRGNKHFRIVSQRTFEYFYRFEQPEINLRYPWEVLNLQGKNRTAFVHGAVSFESVNETVSYATMITDFLYTCCRE